MNDPSPLGRPARAHELQSFAAPPAQLTPTTIIPLQPVIPDAAQLRGRPWRAHELQFFAAPPVLAVPTVLQPLQPIVPFRLPGRPRRAHEYQAFASPDRFVTPTAPSVLAYGAAGAATFVLSIEGAKTIYSWATDIFTSYSGKEKRSSPFGSPRIRIEGNAFLLDADDRDVKAALFRAAAQGSIFLLALPFEELTIAADSPNSSITVDATAGCDWAQPGQRAVIVGVDGSTTFVVVQSATPTSIAIVRSDVSGNLVFGALGTLGNAGGRIMPLLPVLLEPQQGFARYPVSVDLWAMRVRAAVPGWAGTDSMGAGASILSLASGQAIAASSFSDLDHPIWDRSNAIEGTGSDALMSGVELVDLGALPLAIGGQDVPDWARPIRFMSSSATDWQWFKAFLRHLRGRQGAFLLSTNRSDLVFDSFIAGGMKVKSSAIDGAGDYTAWFASAGHRRLAVTTTDGYVQYVEVFSAGDNGDGTISLSLNIGVFGPVDKISFLELVRLESDDVEVTWDGGTFSVDLVARVVQDTFQETTVSNAFAGPGIDGNVTLDGGTAVPGCTLAGNVYTATRDLWFDTVTHSAAVTLNTAGWFVGARTAWIGPTVGQAIVSFNGASASGQAGAVGLPTGTTSVGGGGSGTGATGGSGNGQAAPAFGAWPTNYHPGLGGAGGAGTNAGGAAGGAPSSLTSEATGSLPGIMSAMRMRTLTLNSTLSFSGGAGGSSGGGNGTQAGGGGGAGGGNIAIAVGQFVNAGNIVVQSRGGNGGSGVGSNCGGGGGGSGGMIAVAIGRGSFPVIDASGGNGGSGGGGSGVAGSSGSSGPTPLLFVA